LDADGLQANIRVRSIVGRFLEHSRVFYFALENKGVQSQKMWLSSADWMSRNMLRRIEIAWPITNPQMQARIMQECVNPYLNDTEDAWLLAQNSQYMLLRQSESRPTISAQKMLIRQYEDG
jgi:polyphosphate kinase